MQPPENPCLSAFIRGSNSLSRIIDPGDDLRILALLRITVAELRKRLEISPDFNLLKFHTASPKISFLAVVAIKRPSERLCNMHGERRNTSAELFQIESRFQFSIASHIAEFRNHYVRRDRV